MSKLCSYCGHELRIETGLLNSSPNSPEIEFWHCEYCKHDHMDDEQEKLLGASNE